MDKLRGTMGTLSSMQLTADMKGLDAQSKTILRSAEVLAVILRETVTEYKGYSRKEVMDFNKLPRSKLRGISLDLASLGIFVKRSKLRGIRPVSD